MNIKEYLQSHGISFETIEHEPVYEAQRLAETLHVEGRRVAKAVLLKADRDYLGVVAVVPACGEVDLEKVSKMLGGARIEMATEQDIDEHCPDCEPGVLSPFGSCYKMMTIVDQSLAEEEDEDIHFAAERHDEAVRMKFADFRRIECPLIFPFLKTACRHAAQQQAVG